jgi:hypothetical protein
MINAAEEFLGADTRSLEGAERRVARPVARHNDLQPLRSDLHPFDFRLLWGRYFDAAAGRRKAAVAPGRHS